MAFSILKVCIVTHKSPRAQVTSSFEVVRSVQTSESYRAPIYPRVHDILCEWSDCNVKLCTAADAMDVAWLVGLNVSCMAQ